MNIFNMMSDLRRRVTNDAESDVERTQRAQSCRKSVDLGRGKNIRETVCAFRPKQMEDFSL